MYCIATTSTASPLSRATRSKICLKANSEQDTETRFWQLQPSLKVFQHLCFSTQVK